MKSDHTKRVEQLDELMGDMQRRLSHLNNLIAKAIQADSDAHMVMDITPPGIDREICILMHDLITKDLASYLEMETNLKMTIEAYQSIRNEEHEKATGETVSEL